MIYVPSGQAFGPIIWGNDILKDDNLVVHVVMDNFLANHVK
jgi:hypothetical protein